MKEEVRTCSFVLSIAALVVLSLPMPAHAQLRGAIFTTVADGSAVNFNIYPSKDAVYLDGGPPPGAPQTAASLPDGTYVFQVTDPSGKTLLSTDFAICRQFTVVNGIITGVVPAAGCQHLTGFDIDHNAVTVQLMPYADTPNNGGVYKAWATPVQNYLQGCDALGVANGLNVVDCGITGGDLHGFVPSHSKTDNFKARPSANREIDTHFIDHPTDQQILGMCETWIDTLNVSNDRCSLVNDSIGVQGWAHVENVEDGIHQFVITNQPGCTVSQIAVSQYVGGKLIWTIYNGGPQTIDIRVKPNFASGTINIVVVCN